VIPRCSLYALRGHGIFFKAIINISVNIFDNHKYYLNDFFETNVSDFDQMGGSKVICFIIKSLIIHLNVAPF